MSIPIPLLPVQYHNTYNTSPHLTTQILIQCGRNSLSSKKERNLTHKQTRNSQVVVEDTHGGLECLDIYNLDIERLIRHKYPWHQLLVWLLLIEL